MATHASLANPIFISMDWEQPAPEYGAVREMNISACWLLSNGISRGQKESPTLQSWNRISEAGLDDERPEKTENRHGKIPWRFLHADERVNEILLAALNPSFMHSEDNP